MPTLPIRVMANTTKSTNGCWHWTGEIDKQGYGHIWVGSRTDGSRANALVHRYVYELLVEPLPEKRGEPNHRQVDHRCHNRSKSCPGGPTCLHRRCLNPDHLRAVKAKVNVLAGKGHAARNAVADHCIHDHAFTPENTYYDEDGHRQCKRCQIDNSRRNRRAKAALQPKKPHYQRLKTHCSDPAKHPYSGDNLVIRADGSRGCRKCLARRQAEYRQRRTLVRAR